MADGSTPKNDDGGREQRPGDFSIGPGVWPGLAKLIEEAAEVQQVCGKLIATGGELDHWDGSNLRARIVEELGDLLAAVEFFALVNDLDDEGVVTRRKESKRRLFMQWHREALEQAAGGSRV